MLSNEFYEKLQNFPLLLSKFDGIFSSDTIPKKVKKDHFAICNTDVSSGPGQHWYCYVKVDRQTIECFDSLGITEEKKIFLQRKLCFSGISKINFNVSSVQSSSSNSCGLFVLFFLIQRYYNRDISFDDLLNIIFVESTSENEKIVAEFCADHF